MVDRIRSNRANSIRGVGRPKGGESEFKRVAKARARRLGMLPDELLLEWARTGRMECVDARGRRTIVILEPSDRISCAKGCAAWYKAPMAARRAPGEAPPVYKIELDGGMLTALASKNPDKLEILRDVLRAVQAGGDLLQLGADTTPNTDRYARMLSETSETAGRA